MEKIIKLENVSLAKQGRTILKDLNWQVKRDNIGHILGLNRFWKVYSPVVLLHGLNIGDPG